MPYVPGYYDHYNRPLSALIPNGVFAETVFMTGEGVNHPGLNGLANKTNRSVITPFILVRAVVSDRSAVGITPENPFVLQLGSI
jgi:hypothetical protein